MGAREVQTSQWIFVQNLFLGSRPGGPVELIIDGKRVLTYWENRRNLDYHKKNDFIVATLSIVLWRHSCGCNLDFPLIYSPDFAVH